MAAPSAAASSRPPLLSRVGAPGNWFGLSISGSATHITLVFKVPAPGEGAGGQRRALLGREIGPA